MDAVLDTDVSHGALASNSDGTPRIPTPPPKALLLANDSDAEGAPLTALLGSGPATGTLALLAADGSFVILQKAITNEMTVTKNTPPPVSKELVGACF